MATAANYNSSSSSDEMNAGGYSFELVDNRLEAKFTCICCHLIIRNFMEVRCGNGHAGCRYCIEEWERRMHSNVPTAVCIQCRVEYKKSGKQLSEYMDNLITEILEYKCKQHNRGCTWTGAINDYIRTHKHQCLYRKQKCPNPQCSERCQKIELANHLQICKYDNKKCSICLQDYFAGWKKEHEQNDCFIACENANAGCTVQVSRNYIQKHKLDCEYIIVPCIYYKYGCNHKILRKQIKVHIVNDALFHNDLFIAKLDKLSLQNDKNTSEVDQLKTENRNVQKKNQDLKYENEQLKNKLERCNLKWNGTIIHEVEMEGKIFKFDDVYTMLDENQFESFDELFQTLTHLLNSLRDSFNSSLLMQAADAGKRNVFDKLLEYPQDLSIVNCYGRNIFHRVAWRQNHSWLFDELKKTIHYAKELKELIDKKDDYGRTPLHYAAFNNNHQNIKQLLENGADVNATDIEDERADEYDWCDEKIKRLICDYRNK